MAEISLKLIKSYRGFSAFIMKTNKKSFKILKYIFYLIVLFTVLYIMFNHLGLIDSLDFGAGAYFYADIPDFAKYVDAPHYQSPVSMGFLIFLFLIWGAIMYRFRIWADKK